MNIEEVREFALTLPGATEDMPYGPDVLAFRIEGKIFMHLWLGEREPGCAVKLDPEENVLLREQHAGIQPGYHLNKTHWSDLFINSLDGELVRSLIEKSYMIVRSQLPRKLRVKYE